MTTNKTSVDANNKVISTAVDSAQQKLKPVIAAINGIDKYLDYSNLSSEERLAMGSLISEVYFKLKPLMDELSPAFERAGLELKKYNESRQESLFDYKEKFVDSDGSVLELGYKTVTKQTIHGEELAKRAGLDDTVHVDPSYAKFYPSKMRAPYKRNVVLNDPELCTDPSIVTTTTVSQGYFIFDDNKEKGGN